MKLTNDSAKVIAKLTKDSIIAIVTDPGETYILFDSKAKELGLDNWLSGKSPERESLVKVLKITTHRTEILYAIEDSRGQYIIGTKGLRFISFEELAELIK